MPHAIIIDHVPNPTHQHHPHAPSPICLPRVSPPDLPESPQERGMQLFLRYGSRWGMEALRGLVDVTPLEPGRHCGQFQCPCQYIKEHLQCKPRGYPCGCIVYGSDPSFQYRY